MKTRIALNTEAKRMRVIGIRVAEFMRATQARGNLPATPVSPHRISRFMPAKFDPRLDILPESQLRLWPELDAVPSDFMLYGGTGLALHLGHRASEDFDFFSSSGFEPDVL